MLKTIKIGLLADLTKKSHQRTKFVYCIELMKSMVYTRHFLINGIYGV